MRAFFWFWAMVLMSGYFVMEWLNSIPYEKLWDKEPSPRKHWELHVYKRPRTLHQAPDIVLYQTPSQQEFLKPIHIIRLDDEDDKAELEYAVDWTTDSTALLVLSCDNCTVLNAQYYRLRLGSEPTAQLIPADSITNPDLGGAGLFQTDKIND